MEVLLQQYQTRGLNGDRATHLTPYSIWRIALRKNDGAVVQVHEFNPYDRFSSSIVPSQQGKAEEAALALAKFLEVPIVTQRFVEEVSTSWKEVEI